MTNRFAHWFNQTVIISRMQTVSGDKMAFTTVTACMAQIQPLGEYRTQLVDGVFGKTYKIWCDVTVVINEGDRLRDDAGLFYKVRKGGVQKRSMGSIEYQELIIERTT